VSTDSIVDVLKEKNPEKTLRDAFLPDIQPVNEEESMQDILPLVAQSLNPVPVTDENNKFKGVVSKARFLNTLHKTSEDTDNQDQLTEGV